MSNAENVRALELLAAQFLVPITIADAKAEDCPLVGCNQAFLDLCEYPWAEISGRNCRFMQCGEGEFASRARFAEAIARSSDAEIGITNATKSGRRFLNKVFLFALRSRQPGSALFIATQFDCSQPLPEISERAHKLKFRSAMLLAADDLRRERPLVEKPAPGRERAMRLMSAALKNIAQSEILA